MIICPNWYIKLYEDIRTKVVQDHLEWSKEYDYSQTEPETWHVMVRQWASVVSNFTYSIKFRVWIQN